MTLLHFGTYTAEPILMNYGTERGVAFKEDTSFRKNIEEPGLKLVNK